MNFHLLLKVFVIVLAALVGVRLTRSARKWFNTRIDGSDGDTARRGYMKTLVSVGFNSCSTLILAIAFASLLDAFGVNIAPLLASAGVVGLAISLAAQTLIRDYLAGLIILLENQYAVGHFITVDAVDGTVEKITMRATWVRDLNGRLFCIPNGEVRTVGNASRDWSRAVVDLNIDYNANIGQVVRALETAMRAVARDPEIQPFLRETPQVLGWNSFASWAVQVRLLAKTEAGKQWAVEGVLRRVALEALQLEGLSLAQPGRYGGALQKED